MKRHGFPIFFLFSLFLLAQFFVGPALAQVQENCSTLPEGIVSLRPYGFGTAMQWDAVYGKEGMERLETALALDSGNIVAGGAYWPQETREDTRGLLVEIDPHGRVVWSNRHEQSARMTIRKLLFRLEGKGYIAGGTLAGSDKAPAVIRLGWYGEKGALESERLITEPGYDLSFENMIPALNGGGLVVVGSAQSRDSPKQQKGIIWRLNAKGETLWKRRYDSGAGSRFYGISPAKDDTGNPYYIVTGATQTEDGRTVGAVLKLDPAGTLMWQKEYPRGASALLRAVASYGVRDVIVVGDSEPYGDRYGRSAWVMRIDMADGTPRWQRYFATKGYRVYGRDVVAVADGRASLLLDSERVLPEKAGAALTAGDVNADETERLRDMARITTLSSRGEVLRDEVYSSGTGGRALALVLGTGRHRVMAGYTMMSHKADDRSNEANFDTEDGWVVMGSSLEPYRDPCLPKRKSEE